MAGEEVSTQYSGVAKLFSNGLPEWMPEEHQARVASYEKYDEIYWSNDTAFKLAIEDNNVGALYVPKARTVVDTTAHFLLKGLSITAREGRTEVQGALDRLLTRERFMSLFHISKQSGVARGDHVLHITADDTRPDGRKISITDLHPGSYVPVYDEYDDNKLLRVHIVEQFEVREGLSVKVMLRRLTYEYVTVAGARRVERTEGVFEVRDWFDPKRAKKLRTVLKPELLPEEIDTIPVFHFKNIDWQGDDFGSSELRGFERLLQGINQTMTDSEVALALEGIGVYVTDAAGPLDPDTKLPIPWEIAPGKVLEVPTGAYVKRVEGVGSITPMLDHVRYLESALWESSSTSDIARGVVDVQVAQSGIALALKFLPTLAKIEQRDISGLESLRQLFYNWQKWHAAYENGSGPSDEGDDIIVEIGDKLPQDRTARLNELNNMMDRDIISAKYYRAEMKKLGYEFPETMEADIAAEKQAKFEYAQKLAALNGGGGDQSDSDSPENEDGDRSRNASRRNESSGTEAQ